HRADEGPVGRLRGAVVEQLAERRVGGVAGEVVVVARVVIAGAAAVVAQRADDGEVVRLAGEARQVLAQADAGGGRGDGPELPAELDRGVGLHVPGVDVRGPAREPDQNGGAGDAPARGGCGAARPDE